MSRLGVVDVALAVDVAEDLATAGTLLRTHTKQRAISHSS